jgi:YVTN family beta-propeller protein
MSRKYSIAAGMVVIVGAAAVAGVRQVTAPDPLPTGKYITPAGSQVDVGSFPAGFAMSPDGKFLAVTNTGFRENITIIRAADGKVASQLNFDKRARAGKQSLYIGLTFLPQAADGYRLAASRGPEDEASIFGVDSDGQLSDTGQVIKDPRPAGAKNPLFMAGLATDSTGGKLYAANNGTSFSTNFKGSLSILDIENNKLLGSVPTGGFPLAVAALTKGPGPDRKVYVTSERDSLVSVIDVSDPQNPKALSNIPTGAHPMALLLSPAQDRLYVANASSDTISVIDTGSDKVIDTVLVRPPTARALPGATPTGVALSPDGKRLYVSLGDMNAVAVIDTSHSKARLAGYVPAGWYPSAVAAAPDGRVFVANAKGVQVRNPNGKDVGKLGTYIENIIEGTVSRIDPPGDQDLRAATLQVLENNRANRDLSRANEGLLKGIGIKHVIYIIKENRTYDQVMGDVTSGNGDPSLTLFGKSVTPNEHALAARFVLLDNFYCCSEVSGDGWDWSTSGMASEYTVRNVPFEYSGRPHSYDYEGQNEGVPGDLLGLEDVARAPGGYIWDLVAKKGLTYRNYGFYLNDGDDEKMPDGKPLAVENTPSKKVLVGHTDTDFLHFDTDYPDSDALAKYGLPSHWPLKKYGTHQSPSRFSEWKREFGGYVQKGDFPAFNMVRVMCDHTAGTRPGDYSPRAMVADNDYAVGQIVEAVSHSKFWNDTAIFVVEDDAQDGQDHVDAHRSPAFVISPRIPAGTIDHHFYNTDSILRTMEALMGTPPMSQYDATAPVLDIFKSTGVNSQPYDAILPDQRIITETNSYKSYRARDSLALDFSHEDRVPGRVMADILWGSVHGHGIPIAMTQR